MVKVTLLTSFISKTFHEICQFFSNYSPFGYGNERSNACTHRVFNACFFRSFHGPEKNQR